MKNFSILFVTFLLLPLTTLAHDGRTPQNSGVTDYNTLRIVFFVNSNIGWAGGGRGDPSWNYPLMIHTTDSGNTLEEQVIPLYGVTS